MIAWPGKLIKPQEYSSSLAYNKHMRIHMLKCYILTGTFLFVSSLQVTEDSFNFTVQLYID